MAELLLTPEEEAAASWLDLDDASLGRMIKASMCMITAKDENSAIYTMTAGMLLAVLCHQSNADEADFELVGVTSKGIPIGDWEISVRRKP